MSKQQIFVKHKDEIMLEILRLHRLKFCDDEHRPKIEAEAVNHGKIQGLMWAAGLYNNSKDKSSDVFDQWYNEELPIVTGDRDTDALLEDERKNQEEI